MYVYSKTGSVGTGNVGEVKELKHVGEKKTAVIKFSVAVAKDGDKTVWWNCEAWGKLATYVDIFVDKGDVVMVTGTWKSHEYEGKTYNTLSADFLQKMELSKSAGKASTTPSAPVQEFEELDEDDGDLPF